MQQMRRHILYMSNKYTLGIDIGSTTVKIAILDENDTLLFADYQRHFANIQETLAELLAKAYGKLGELTLHPVITGSGGLTLANHLGVPFVQSLYIFSACHTAWTFVKCHGMVEPRLDWICILSSGPIKIL